MNKIKIDGIEKLREEIDEIDCKIAELIIKRFKVVENIAKIKKERNLNLVDMEREKEVYRRYRRMLSKYVSEDFVENLVSLILEESKRLQRKII